MSDQGDITGHKGTRTIAAQARTCPNHVQQMQVSVMTLDMGCWFADGPCELLSHHLP
jgi:hypothetical protein